MRNWQPRKARDIFKPGYGDRFNYYTQLFALFIAVIGAIGVILAIIQTAYAIVVAKDNSVELAVQNVSSALARVEDTLLSLLNVTEELVLAIHSLRLNSTG